MKNRAPALLGQVLLGSMVQTSLRGIWVKQTKEEMHQ